MAQAGYSGTPLARKLGIKEGDVIKLVQVPDNYFSLFQDFPENVEIADDTHSKKNLIHYFTKSASELHKEIEQLKSELQPNGALWISWPKKAAKVPTDLDGNIVRESGLRHGLVDIKVCAVDTVWSGLKFVIPLKNRQ